MTTSRSESIDSSEEDSTAQGRRVLESLRLYRAADSAMRRRTQEEMSMGDNELLAMRMIIRQTRENATTTPTDVARYLGITTTATTALLDKLEKAGHIGRTAHPRDRRMIALVATDHSAEEVRTTLSDAQERMLAATRTLSAQTATEVIDFLEELTRTVDRILPHDEA
ncbi:MarR family transcriptional regulator (plasmid) [Coraliomargarita sp. W4R53]